MCGKLENLIKEAGQEHLLRFTADLSAGELAAFEAELSAVNWAEIPRLAAEYVLKKPEISIPSDLAPAAFYPLTPADAAQKELYAAADAKGKELLKAGKVCCLTVAGGQGTRLGFDGPKGTYPIGPATNRTLFSYFAQSIARASEKYGKPVNWYIMTSPINREATESYFKAEKFFGLKEENVFFFTQGTMPAFGLDGKLLLSSKSSLALSPDGHGGTLLALRKSGALDKMIADGCEYISYFQVDNPLVPVVSPRFIGLHALENSEMSAIMLSKTNSREKLGNFCVSGGRTMIIEYSDLPDELAEKRNADGSLAFVAGSPAIHVLSRNFVEKLTSGGTLQLPWHRADKKIASLDADGNKVAPDAPNGVKLESFIFDALPLAEKVMILEGDRAEVFAPTKNATGVDSAESCRLMLTARNARRLELAGVEVPRTADGQADAVIELSPRLVLDDEDAIELVKANGLKKIFPGEVVVL
ncbi:MAG: UTP--glucose-1-phosphate uridylyltransferase [Lentisphaeria bacterium]|nr:UTP--glucose-1-phosphate uridylyltransferase [Lentisphaeria bacterium]